MKLLDYQAPKNLLQDRIILVTGAGDGIGKAAAISFASHGATVVLAGKTIAKLEAVYDDISNRGAPQPAIYPIDFGGAQPGDYEQMAERLQQEFGRLDGLLHNAGILGPHQPIQSVKAQGWMEVMQINLNAPFLLSKYLLPLLAASPDASLLFTSSSVGRKGRAFWGPYAVSKFGCEGLMQVLADELEDVSNIRVNSLNPGATDTAMRRQAYPGENPASNPQPEQLMAAWLYLIGPDSKGIHGQALDAQPRSH